MNKTHDFKFNLPEYSDSVDIDDINENFGVIDDALMAGLCKKEYTGNNMGSNDPATRNYAWAPWFEIVNDNEFDVTVTDRNFETTITIEAGKTHRQYINGTYYMNFYVQDLHDVTFRWFINAQKYIDESQSSGGGSVFSRTLLWDYVNDNNGTIPYGPTSLTLHDAIENYDALVIDFVSSSTDASGTDWNGDSIVTIDVFALINSRVPNHTNITTFDERSAHFYISGTTFQKTKTNVANTNGVVKIYGLKY